MSASHIFKSFRSHLVCLISAEPYPHDMINHLQRLRQRMNELQTTQTQETQARVRKPRPNQSDETFSILLNGKG